MHFLLCGLWVGVGDSLLEGMSCVVYVFFVVLVDLFLVLVEVFGSLGDMWAP